uniref:DUF11 domain-containing protein n=1 Tax=Schlesneria paludicola TaxID=360056 RepID=A0A7C4LN53_9PLAN
MGSIGKIAAMSVVIGVGLVVVWQAQQGMKLGLPSRLVESHSAAPSQASEPESGTAVLAASSTLDEQVIGEQAVAPFSVGPLFGDEASQSSLRKTQTDSSSTAPAELADARAAARDSTETEIRYHRQTVSDRTVAADADHDPFGSDLTAAASERVDAAIAEEDPFASAPQLPQRSPPTPQRVRGGEPAVRTADVSLSELDAQPAVLPVAADSNPLPEQPPVDDAADPFAVAAPPAMEDLPRKGNSSTRSPNERSSPSTNQPFSNRDRTSPGVAGPLPDLLDEESAASFGDSAAEPVAADDQRLLNLGEPAPLKSPPRSRPTAQETADPFGPEPVLPVADAPALLPSDDAPLAPERTPVSDPAIERQRPESSVGRSPRGANPPELPPRQKSVDLLKGDGQVPGNAPRGVQEPRLTIQKIAPPKAVLGEELVYAVIIKNVGGSPASQVVVEDRIPKGARLIGTAPRAELMDKRLIWKLGTLQPNEERKIAIKVIPEEEGPLGSVAKVNFVSEVAAEIVVTAPQLKLRVTAPAEVKIGDEVELVFTISNPGNGDARNVVLRSLLPEGLRHPSGNDLEYVVGDLPAGQSREVPLSVTAVKIGRLLHKALVTGEGNVTADAETTLDVFGEQLVLTRKGQNRAFVGKPTMVVNQVGNEGDRPVARVQVTEVVPAGFEFVEASQGGRFDPKTRTITWTVGPVAPGEEQSVSATLLPKSTGRYEGTVTAAGMTGSVATVKASVTVEGVPALTIEPLDDQRVVAVGETVRTQIQLRNRGTARAQRVGLSILVPDELRVLSAKGPSAHEIVGQQVIFEPVAELGPRDSATYELELEAVSEGDSRLDLQMYAEHLRRPVRHEEVLQVVSPSN